MGYFSLFVGPTTIASSLIFTVFAQAIPDMLPGASGWVSSGILGAILSWLFFVYLPAKDKQIKELLEMQTVEREKDRDERGKDRTARHETAALFQRAVVEIHQMNATNSREERESFLLRSTRLEDRIEEALDRQTGQLREAINSGVNGACRALQGQYQPTTHVNPPASRKRGPQSSDPNLPTSQQP